MRNAGQAPPAGGLVTPSGRASGPTAVPEMTSDARGGPVHDRLDLDLQESIDGDLGAAHVALQHRRDLRTRRRAGGDRRDGIRSRKNDCLHGFGRRTDADLQRGAVRKGERGRGGRVDARRVRDDRFRDRGHGRIGRDVELIAVLQREWTDAARRRGGRNRRTERLLPSDWRKKVMTSVFLSPRVEWKNRRFDPVPSPCRRTRQRVTRSAPSASCSACRSCRRCARCTRACRRCRRMRAPPRPGIRSRSDRRPAESGAARRIAAGTPRSW